MRSEKVKETERGRESEVSRDDEEAPLLTSQAGSERNSNTTRKRGNRIENDSDLQGAQANCVMFGFSVW